MDTSIYKEPLKLLRELLRFDTSNPPGYEKDCCMYIKEILAAAGIETRVYALDVSRPNLWAEIKSECPKKPPLLLYGHIDVVPAEPSDWSHPPFAGEIDGGYIYGRGAVDMKSAVAMYMCVMLKVKLEEIKLDFDLILLVLSDEEDTGKYGAKYMVENHSYLFENIGCALGEMGGFSLHIGGKRFYPVMVAEKQCAEIKMTFQGRSGHGSARHYDTAMEKMSRAVAALSTSRLKTRITGEVTFMLNELAKGLGGTRGFFLRRLLNSLFTNMFLDMMKDEGLFFDNLLHNSINVTIVHGGSAINVVPGNVYIEADLRLLPGCTIEAGISDIEELLAKKAGLSERDYTLEIVQYDKNDFKPDLKNYASIKKTLIEADSDGIPFPYVFSAVTDGRIFSRAGVMTYGFTPLLLPPDFDFVSQAHTADERLPVDSLAFGVDTLMLFLTKYY